MMEMDHNLMQRNRRVFMWIMLLVFGMVGLAFASVPLYQLFCQVTGYGGTTKIASAPSEEAVGSITREVRFDANVQPGMQWRFEAPAPIELRAGEEIKVHYTASNLSDETITGQAHFNVTPFKVGSYFAKIECFCFQEQTLKPGETVEMPVIFFLDEAMDSDMNTREVAEVTLSYTFFPLSN